MHGPGSVRDASLAALLVAPDRSLAERLQGALQAGKCFEVLGELRSYPTEQTLEIRLRQVQPDVVFLDLASDFEIASGLLRALAAVQPPVQVVGFHSANDPEILVRSLRAGATEFLWAPFDAAAQREAAARIRRLRQPAGSPRPEWGQVLAFTAAKPGAGSTTLAVHTALALRRLSGKRILLADFDSPRGAVAFALRLGAAHSIHDALECLDMRDAGGSAAKLASVAGMDVLPAFAGTSSPAQELNRFHDLLEHLRRSYDWVVVDLPNVFERLSLFTLAEADQSLIVATSELPSLHLARRAVAVLSQLGFSKERYQLVVNRTNGREEIAAADLEKIFGCSVFATCPNDRLALQRAAIRGEPASPDCEFGRSISSLASRLSGLAGKDGKATPGLLTLKPGLSAG